MNDKEIIYNILGRYIDNALSRTRNPLFIMMAEPLKNYAFRAVSPYIDAFVGEQGFEVEAASAFLKEEALDKINLFKKTFKEKQHEDIEDNF